MKKKHKFRLATSSNEAQAMDLLRPFDPYELNPVLYQVTKETVGLYNYFRLSVSSADQGISTSMGRAIEFFVVDKTSGCFLGLFSIMSPGRLSPIFEKMCGWDKDVPMEGRPQTKNAIAFTRARSVMQLSRCLPIYEFGPLLGGKLLTMSAMCKDVLDILEAKYSLPFVMLYWSTLHGKASQYSRLEQSGVSYIGSDTYDNRERGVYLGEWRKNALKFLRGEIENPGKILTPDYATTVEQWRERWYNPRLISKNVPKLITPNKDAYRLSDRLLTSYQHRSLEEPLEPSEGD